MKKIIPLLIIQMLISVSVFSASENATPAGYTWYKIPTVEASILKPDGWHISKPKAQKGTITFHMSKEAPAEAAHTVLDLKVNKWVDEHFPMYYGTEFMFGFSGRGESWIHGQPIQEDKDGWSRGGLTVEKEITVGKITQKYTIQYFLISNPETHTLYTFTFRTPSTEWEENKNIWTTMSTPKLDKKL